MRAITIFLKPTRIKLVFLLEWVLFILIAITQGKLNSINQVIAAGYPLVFFYLIACTLAALSFRIRRLAQLWVLLMYAIGLAILDQVAKAIVVAFVPYQESIPAGNKFLCLAHEHNIHGSWILRVFNVQSAGVIHLVQWVLVIPVLLCSILCHRYYITTNRESLWPDIVFLGVFAGLLSWLCDMLFRGYIVDYIVIPGLVAADFKDILVTLGTAAFFAEIMDNPELSWRWGGWQKEKDDLFRLVKNFWNYAIQELRNICQSVRNKFGKPTTRK